MSSLALMRWLESAPARYDAGMRWITLGRVAALHAGAARAAAGPGARVLEIGCGTGALTLRLVERGARVTAYDQNPAMLERARERLRGAPSGAVSLVERTASEIAAPGDAGAFDAVVAALCLSEMSASERAFVLERAAACLRPGGRMVLADEAVPRGRGRRLLWRALRAPQAALAWLLAGSVSRPIADPAEELRRAGFAVRSERRWLGGTLALVVAERPA